jgi:alanine racemase
LTILKPSLLTKRLANKKQLKSCLPEVFVGSPLSCTEIDLSAITHNLEELRRVTRPTARLMAVIKANAYGHGALEVARLASEMKVDWLGVANLQEGIHLRQSGIKLPVLIFGYTQAKLAPALQEFHLTPSVYSLDMARALSENLASGQTPLSIHVKLDTGMGRLGILVSDDPEVQERAVKEVQSIAALKKLRLQGLYTHFADADSGDKSYSKLQLARFLEILNTLKGSGISPEIAHAANSAAVIDFPESHLDLVRPGISLYGSYPSAAMNQNRVELIPAMTLKTKIIQLKNVPKGFKVSYNMTWEAPTPTVIATIPLGYADGFNRLLSSNASVLVNGQRARVAGRVCMDLTLLDVGHIPGVAVEDDVVVFGKQGKETLLVEELAQAAGTISYEIYTRIGDRIERIYKPVDPKQHMG